MPISIKCKLLLYADDSALIVSGSDPQTIADKLSEELESCRKWLLDNKLSLHLGKTEAILFGSKRKLRNVESFEIRCGKEILNHVNSVKYLGVQIDENMSGDSIVKEIIKKANTRLKFLYRNKNLLNFQCRKILCTALIQCHFDYSCSSWYPGINKGLKDKLQITQNKITRFILNYDNRAHIGHKELAKAGFLNVSDRVKQLKLGHVFKIKNKTSPYYLSTNFQRLNEIENSPVTRGTANNFLRPRIYTDSFAYSAICEWNELPSKIKDIKGEKNFKDSLKKYLLDKAEKKYNPYIYY